MSRKDYPTLEENIRFIISEVGAETVLGAMSSEEVLQKTDQKALFSELVEQMGSQAPQQVVRNIDKEALFSELVEQMGIKKSQQLLQKLSQENGRDNER